MSSNIYLSKQKVKELTLQLKRLDSTLKRQNEEHVRGGGNAESHTETAAFRATQRTLEAKVNSLKIILSEAKELPDKVTSDNLVLGSWVKLEKEDKTHIKYRLVHPLEADPEKYLISIQSPLGERLLGKKQGDHIEMNGHKFIIKGIL